ncbi:MAG TPA: BamA/TamA family outer membrane protein, partial [Pyrinomonadaceae bacterium]
ILTAGVSVWAQTATAVVTNPIATPTRQSSDSQPVVAKQQAAPVEQTAALDNETAQQTATSPAPPKQNKSATAKPKKPKRGQLVIAPIPVSSPAVGSGLVLVGLYVFKVKESDMKSPPSVVGLVGAFTNNGSRGGALGGRLYFSENKYQTTFALAKGRANFDFFGIGRRPNAEGISVPLTVKGTIFFGEFMRNVGKDIFIGPRFQHRNLEISLDGTQTPGGFVIPEIDRNTISAALGIHVQRDKRDSTFYPRKGSLLDVTGDFFAKGLGSRRQYQTYKVSYQLYHSLAPKQVLAYRGMICSANQSVPFYDLCLYGTQSNLRGYTAGEFQNRRMFATQAEYRRELKGRFGVVGFGGLGGIARRWNEFRSDELLPAAGGGLRFTLDKKNHINYRIDWAVGRNGHTLSIGVGEAF